jgi:hypothetical protein
MKIAHLAIFRGFAGRLLSGLPFFIALSFPAVLAGTPPKEHLATLDVAEIFVSKGQQFSCSTDYSERDCIRQLSALRDQLAVYHADSLGAWTWIIVSSAKWKPLSEALGVPSNSPAMTSYVDRETLFDESLFAPSRADALELTREYHLPLKELMVRTLTHEMGHAYCGDPDEQRTEQVAEQIRRGIRPSCALFAMHAPEKVANRDPGK